MGYEINMAQARNYGKFSPKMSAIFISNGHGDCYSSAKTLDMKKKLLLLACIGIMKLNAQNPGVSQQDKSFAEMALMGNLKELKYSQLALNKGFSPEVKELAQHIVEDHKKADDLLRQITAGKSITVPSALDADEQKDFEKLSNKEGEDFDKAYTDCMVKDHKKTIRAYEKETKKGENTEFRAFATNTLPSIIHHKNMAEETCKKIGKK